ncbi:hypothetical protein [Leeuwenhoekiella sp. H156]|uniref:hypothetical protein n=1 Tax=Leeuwenhoekiella sp. H156 TaxID=3450128 RepID=UPI003FA40BE2
MIRSYLSFLVVLSLTLWVSSCSTPTFNSSDELTEYITAEDSEYLVSKVVNGVDFSMLYRPTDLLVFQELSTGYTQEEVDSLRSKYGSYLYFNLSMSKNNQELLNGLAADRNRFGAMVNTLAFGMGDKLNLITATRDTVALADYVYPRMYGMSRSTTMMLVYPKEEVERAEGDYFTLTLQDLGFGTGEVSFKFPKSVFTDQPGIEF